MILVTGATGNVGTELIKKLSASGQAVRAFVRERTRAEGIAVEGVEFAEGDFENLKTFPPALQSVEQLFLLAPSSSTVEKQQCDLVDAARQSGVRHIVKLSQFGADENARGRFQRYHGSVENYIVKTGTPYTFLRPNLFMQGLLNFRQTIATEGAFYAAAGNASISAVDVRDIAAVAAKALTEPGHEGKSYDITGPEALTHTQMAEQLSKAGGRNVKYIDVPPEKMRKALLDLGMLAWQVEGVLEDYDHYRRGEAEMVAPAVRKITGKEAIPFQQFAKDYMAVFFGRTARAV